MGSSPRSNIQCFTNQSTHVPCESIGKIRQREGRQNKSTIQPDFNLIIDECFMRQIKREYEKYGVPRGTTSHDSGETRTNCNGPVGCKPGDKGYQPSGEVY